MRGITPVIAIILLLLMAVAAAGGFYFVSICGKPMVSPLAVHHPFLRPVFASGSTGHGGESA